MHRNLQMTLVTAFLALSFPAGQANAQSWKEKDVQACLCKGMKTEVRMPSGGRADCLSDTHAIEIDKTNNWAEAIGQSLYYAQQTGKQAMVILYCKKERGRNCSADGYRFDLTVRTYGLPIESDFYGWADLRDICR